METTGKFIKSLPEVSGTSKAGKEWSKQDFVIETEGQYPKNICFTAFGDKADGIKNLNPGDQVKVRFDIESKEYNGKYFSNINAFGIELVKSASSQNQSSSPSDTQSSYDTKMPDDDGDLPF